MTKGLEKHGYETAFGGTRRDEEASCAMECMLSFRTSTYRWDPKKERSELWEYIQQEKIPIVKLYFAKERPIVERDGMLVMVDDHRFSLRPDETPVLRSVRFRALGCYPLIGAIESSASTFPEIIQKMSGSRTSEPQGQLIKRDAFGSMEKKKQEGYF